MLHFELFVNFIFSNLLSGKNLSISHRPSGVMGIYVCPFNSIVHFLSICVLCVISIISLVIFHKENMSFGFKVILKQGHFGTFLLHVTITKSESHFYGVLSFESLQWLSYFALYTPFAMQSQCATNYSLFNFTFI